MLFIRFFFFFIFFFVRSFHNFVSAIHLLAHFLFGRVNVEYKKREIDTFTSRVQKIHL